MYACKNHVLIFYFSSLLFLSQERLFEFAERIFKMTARFSLVSKGFATTPTTLTILEAVASCQLLVSPPRFAS